MAANRPYGENYFLVNAMTAGDKRLWLTVEHESDLCLRSISIHLVSEVCYERLVSSVTINSSQHRKSHPKKSVRTMKRVKANTRHSVITAEHLSRNMNIRLEKDKHMMRATTHKGIQTELYPITRQ